MTLNNQYNVWLNDPAISEKDKDEIRQLVQAGDETELNDRFFQLLEFGTGGIRGIVAQGLNRMNVYNIRRATEALCRYLRKVNPGQSKIAVFYDSRTHSRLFAEETAGVIAGNGFECVLSETCSATPILSFVIPVIKFDAGINITASHNPPEYNGYKVFWSGGEQVIPPHDKAIIEEFNQIATYSEVKYLDFQTGLEKKLIQYLPESLYEQYYEAVENICSGDKASNEKLKVVYTPLHGVGGKYLKALAAKRNFGQFRMVDSQAQPDGNFPTLKSPNPEDPGAFAEATKMTSDFDLVIATDPDADRLGCLIKDVKSGKNFRPDGNLIGAFFLEYLMRKKPKPNHYFVTTVVSSPLLVRIAEKNNVNAYLTYTGFKNIAGVIADKNAAGQEFLFGCEESHGYQLGDFIRDKDGISAAIFFAEMVAELKADGISIDEHCEGIYSKYGFQTDEQVSFTLKGFNGIQQIKQIMELLRKSPPAKIADFNLVEAVDFSQRKDFTGERDSRFAECIGNTNMLMLEFAGDFRMIARPSGTEPKIKFYLNCGNPERDLHRATLNQCKEVLGKIVDSVS